MIVKKDRNCQVKDYISKKFCIESDELVYIRENSLIEGLRPIAVPAHVGKMLYLLARMQNAKKILEIGTLGGYSTIWLARALVPGGKIISLELEEPIVALARQHIAHAKMEDRIEVRQGDAATLMREMIASKEESFDLIFIDADKQNYPTYLTLALELSRSGTLILTDNLIPKRDEIGPHDPQDNEAEGIYACNDMLASDPRLESMLFTTIVGDHGRVDALGVAIVL